MLNNIEEIKLLLKFKLIIKDIVYNIKYIFHLKLVLKHYNLDGE